MARPKALVPKLRYHLSGQSVVTILGRDFYVGPHNSPESLARYAYLIREYQANGMTAPPGIDRESLKAIGDDFAIGQPAIHEESQPITVKHVTAGWRAYAEKRYKPKDQDLQRGRQACQLVDKMFGESLAEDFGPKALQRVRQVWIDSDMSRGYVNRMVNTLVRIYSWATMEELIEAAAWQRLKSVPSIRVGQNG